MTAAREAVVLTHGLWTHGVVMSFLARQFSRRGYVTRTVSYPSLRGEIEGNAARLARVIAATDADRIHLVGHSLGGLVVLRALERSRDPRIARVVLLGAPVHGCEAGRRLDRIGAGRMLLGRSAPLWRERPRFDIPPGVEIGAIAGTIRIGVGALVMPFRPDSDGVVGIEETRLPGLAAHVALPVSHSGMLVSPQVARQAAAFLASGAFLR